jgi:hypothetical protein
LSSKFVQRRAQHLKDTLGRRKETGAIVGC